MSTACDVCRAPAISPRLPDTVRVLGFVLILLAAGNVRETLMAVYDATDGPNWRQDTNWGSDRPLGEWHGVTTDQSGRVTDLDLGFNGLAGPIPAALGALAHLEALDLSFNTYLTGPIPAALGALANIEQLRLNYSGLTGPVPDWLGDLANLEVLDLSFNNLTGTIPAALGALARLESLSLWGNGLTGPIPPALATLANLRYLTLQRNALTGPIPAELGALARLQHISLWGASCEIVIGSGFFTRSAIARDGQRPVRRVWRMAVNPS